MGDSLKYYWIYWNTIGGFLPSTVCSGLLWFAYKSKLKWVKRCNRVWPAAEGYSFRKELLAQCINITNSASKQNATSWPNAFLLLANVRAQLPGNAWLAWCWHMRWQFGITCVAFDAGISRPEDCSRSYIAWPKHGNTSDHHHGHWDGHVVLLVSFFLKQWASMPAYMRLWLEWHILCIIPTFEKLNKWQVTSMKSIPLKLAMITRIFFEIGFETAAETVFRPSKICWIQIFWGLAQLPLR